MWRDRHPTPPRVTRASTRPLQGRVKQASYTRFIDTEIFGPFLMV